MAVTFTAIGTALGAAGTTATVVGATVTLVATTALSYGVAKLTAPDLGDLQSQLGKGGRQINTKDPNAAIEIVYGTIRKGGVVTYQATTNWIIPGGGNNRVLRQVIVVAGHEVNTMTPTRVWINDVEWEVNEYGYVTDQKFTGPGGTAETDNQWKYNSSTNRSFLFVGKHKGDQTSPDDLFEGLTALGGLSGSMTLNHKNITGPLENNAITGKNATLADFVGHGLSYMYVEMVYDPEVFDSVPLITTVVQGKKVYDPEYGTTSFSNNPALCILDYLESEYGLDVDTSYTDRGSSGSFKLAADDCRVDSGSTSNNAFTCNGILLGGDSHQKNLEKLLSSCDGTLIFSGGKWKLFIGKDRSSTATTLTLDNLRGPIKVQTKASKSERFNEVGGDFVDSDNRWLRGSYPVVKSATFLSNDDGQVSRLELSLPMTTSHVVAQRLAKIQLFRSREEIVVNVRCDLTAIDLDVGDWVKLVVDRYGWTDAQNKYFEVKGYAMVFDEGAPQIDLILKEISAAVFDWDSEEQDITSNNADPFSIANIVDSLDSLTTPSATASGYFLGDGTYQPTINLTWTGLDDIYVDGYQVRYYVTSDGISTAQTVTLGRDTTFYRVLTDGESEYTISLRAFSERTMGSFKTITQVSAKDSTAPSAPTVVSPSADHERVRLEVTAPTEQDVMGVEVFNTTNSGTTPTGSSTPSFFIPASPSETVFYNHEKLTNGTAQYYFFRSVDYSDNASAWSIQYNATPLLRYAEGATVGAQVGVNLADENGTDISTNFEILNNEIINDSGDDLGKIKDDLVITESIAANAVTANKILVDDLSAINADIGDITAGTLKGGTVPDADDVPSGSETGAFLNLSDGKFVFGDADHNILFDGTDLKINGDIITDLGGSGNNHIVFDGDTMDITGTLSSDDFVSGYGLKANHGTKTRLTSGTLTAANWDLRNSLGTSLTLNSLGSVSVGDFLHLGDYISESLIDGSTRFRLEWSSDYYIEFSLINYSSTSDWKRAEISVITERSSYKSFTAAGVSVTFASLKRFGFEQDDSIGWTLKNSGDVEAQAITAKEINQVRLGSHVANNLVLGDSSTLSAITTGVDNIALGPNAAPAITTEDGNVALGADSVVAAATDNATAIGTQADVSADRAIALGYNATASGTDSIAIGANVTASSNDQIKIGSSQTAVTVGSYDLSDFITSADGGDAATLDGLDSTQFLRSDADDSISANLSFGDNNKAIFGAGSDLQIYHDGSNSNIAELGTGNLTITGGGPNVSIVTGSSENMAVFTNNGAVTLYYNNAQKLATTSTGVDVTGVITADDYIQVTGSPSPYIELVDTDNNVTTRLQSLNTSATVGTESDHDLYIQRNNTNIVSVLSTGISVTGNATFADNGKAIFGAGSDLQIYHDGSNSYIKDAGTGNLNIQANQLRIQTDTGENFIECVPNAQVVLRYDNSVKLQTTSTGVDVTGNIAVSGTVDGRDIATDGTKLDGIETGATADQTKADIDALGINADQVDGLEASQFLRSDADDTMTGDLRVDGALGINTTALSGVANLHISSSGDGTTLLRMTDGVTGKTALDGLIMGLDGDQNGYLINSESSALRLGTSNTERARLDADGNLLVGTTSTGVGSAASGEGFNYINGQDLQVARDGGDVMNLNRQGTDGVIARFRKDGSTVGSIGVALTDNLFIGGDSSHATVGFGSANIYPATATGNVSDNTTDLGLSSSRFKDIYLSGSVNLGSTIVFEGSTEDADETTLTVTDPTVPRTITLPDRSGTVMLWGSDMPNDPATGNIAIGESSLQNIGSGANYNTAVGDFALSPLTTGDFNTSVGYNSSDTTTGSHNTHIGYFGGPDGFQGNNSYQVSVGSGAHPVGNYSISVGYEAGGLHNSNYNDSSNSIYIGAFSGQRVSGASYNVCVGTEVMASNSVNPTGDNNVAMGNLAAYNLSSGSSNVIIGSSAGRDATTAAQNTFVGIQAGRETTTGQGHTFLGAFAGYATDSSADFTGSDLIAIGRFAKPSSYTASNEITLGSTSITTLRCNVQTISSLSDERDKTDIADIGYGLDFIKAMRPVEFTWDRRDGTRNGVKDMGFIAQELAEVEYQFSSGSRTRLVQIHPDKFEADPMRTYPIMVKAMQEMAAKIEQLEARIADLEGA